VVTVKPLASAVRGGGIFVIGAQQLRGGSARKFV
jgi:hypothetical protein